MVLIEYELFLAVRFKRSLQRPHDKMILHDILCIEICFTSTYVSRVIRFTFTVDAIEAYNGILVPVRISFGLRWRGGKT